MPDSPKYFDKLFIPSSVNLTGKKLIMAVWDAIMYSKKFIQFGEMDLVWREEGHFLTFLSRCTQL